MGGGELLFNLSVKRASGEELVVQGTPKFGAGAGSELEDRIYFAV